MESFRNLIKIRLWKFYEHCLKTVWGDRFLMKLSFFAFLVSAFHKEPIEIADFDTSYVENCFEFLKVVKNNR